MEKKKVGFLHPGQMGIFLAASAKNTGHTVYWVSEGRGRRTYERAAEFSLLDAHTLKELCGTCSIIVSVCPPHAAEEVANQVLATSFGGVYLDANAISPQRAKRIGQAMAEAGVSFVDGGIIGVPAPEPGNTWLYLSGKEADLAASCFTAGPIEPIVIGESIGKASSLKMCFAAYTKRTTALLCAILATAETLGVREDLERQWSRDGSGFAEQTKERVRQVTAKAWRFTGEMEEIAATFKEAGVPGDFHAAAAMIYRRIAHFKDAMETPSLEEVLAALARNGKTKAASLG